MKLLKENAFSDPFPIQWIHVNGENSSTLHLRVVSSDVKLVFTNTVSILLVFLPRHHHFIKVRTVSQ